MNVLIVFNHPAPYKVKLFNELAKHITLHVIFERDKAKDRPLSFYNENEYRFKVTFLKKGAFGNENSNTNELKDYIKRNYSHYDLIIMNGYSTFTEIKAILYMIKNRIRYVLLINGGVIHKDNYFKRHIKKYLISKSFKYMSPCLEADEYLLFYGARKEDIYHYPYSTFYNCDVLNCVIDDNEKNKIRKELNLLGSPLFVSAGQFIERKNNLLLLSIFKNRPENLLLIGSGPLEEKYKEYIKGNNMKNVLLLSFLPKKELFHVLRCCDYFITLSKEDIYGHTIAEAMANGLPVISSNKVISSKHLITNRENGFIVDINDVSSIINAIESMNNIMSIKAIETARMNTIEKTVEACLYAFKEINKCK